MRKPSGRHRGTNKTLSFASVILLGINGIIGSGIFLLPGTLIKKLAWVVSARLFWLDSVQR